MSFVSGVVITMLEKELAAQTPEVEAYVLQLLGRVATDLVAYVEKKVNPAAQPAQPVNGAS
jgi:hypothetical protein